MPTLMSKTVPPFIQKLDLCDWNVWLSAKQKKFSRLVREFKSKTKQMIRDEEEDDPVINEQVNLAASWRLLFRLERLLAPLRFGSTPTALAQEVKKYRELRVGGGLWWSQPQLPLEEV